MRLMVRGGALRTRRLAGLRTATLAIFSLRYSVLLACDSATWTAPPPMMAQPAAQADNFARATRTDINAAFFSRQKCSISKEQVLSAWKSAESG
ncbi:hypothetical protein WSK_0363 [Novosphingobium sp. Rr 2-17]|nr:hypothetical protein WSK_0363 [Novosphingobium sp. Rr 2-17]